MLLPRGRSSRALRARSPRCPGRGRPAARGCPGSGDGRIPLHGARADEPARRPVAGETLQLRDRDVARAGVPSAGRRGVGLRLQPLRCPRRGGRGASAVSRVVSLRHRCLASRRPNTQNVAPRAGRCTIVGAPARRRQRLRKRSRGTGLLASALLTVPDQKKWCWVPSSSAWRWLRSCSTEGRLGGGDRGSVLISSAVTTQRSRPLQRTRFRRRRSGI
jgi:hypothetical protein